MFISPIHPTVINSSFFIQLCSTKRWSSLTPPFNENHHPKLHSKFIPLAVDGSVAIQPPPPLKSTIKCVTARNPPESLTVYVKSVLMALFWTVQRWGNNKNVMLQHLQHYGPTTKGSPGICDRGQVQIFNDDRLTDCNCSILPVMATTRRNTVAHVKAIKLSFYLLLSFFLTLAAEPLFREAYQMVFFFDVLPAVFG